MQSAISEWITYTSVLHPTEPDEYTGSYTAVRYYRVKNIAAKEETV